MTTQVGIATAWHDERRRDRATGKVIAVACLEGWAVAGSRAVRDLAARRAADLVLISLGYELEGGAFGEAEAMAAQAKTAAIVAILDAVASVMSDHPDDNADAVLWSLTRAVEDAVSALPRDKDSQVSHLIQELSYEVSNAAQC